MARVLEELWDFHGQLRSQTASLNDGLKDLEVRVSRLEEQMQDLWRLRSQFEQQREEERQLLLRWHQGRSTLLEKKVTSR